MLIRKRERSLKEDCRLIVRGLKELNKILPKQMNWISIKCILVACTPYVAVTLSALILDELVGTKDQTLLSWYIGIAVGLMLLMGILQSVYEAKIAIGFDHLFSSHEMNLTHKAFHLPYEVLESEKTQRLREQVSGSISVSGAGMASLYWDFEGLLMNFCRVITSFILTFSFIRNLIEAVCNKTLSMSQMGIAMGVIVGLIVGGSYLACKVSSKRFAVSFDVFQKGANYMRYGEFYTMNYLPDEDRALDIRLFEQKSIILKETQEKCYKHFAEGKIKEMHALSKMDASSLMSTFICGLAIYSVLGYLVPKGVVGIGSVIMIYSAVTLMIQSLSEIAATVTDIRDNNVHLKNYFEYMDMEEEKSSQGKGKTLPKQEESEMISFEKVSFKYPESEQWVLKDINLTIQRGQRIAIVGENGSGKTTLIKLLCKMYHPTEGRILLNGQDIWAYDQESYIKEMATVFQDFRLFAFPIAENVAASKEYDEVAIYEALCKAGFRNKVDRLEKGIHEYLFHYYETDGVELSGGEQQKIAIARAFYKKAKWMILDEPTAALDPYAEQEIFDQLFKEMKGETMLAISHRLSVCRYCTQILVMKQGKLVEQGSHEELVEKGGDYKVLWDEQAQYYV